MLAHADQYGIVDKHHKAISEETGLSRQEVEKAILNLEAPDDDSRSPEHNGRRILRLDEHRTWGWKIVNYGKYRAIKSEDDRREQNRNAQEKWRNKSKQPSALVSTRKPPSASVSRDKPPSAQAEAEGEEEELKPAREAQSEKAIIVLEGVQGDHPRDGAMAEIAMSHPGHTHLVGETEIPQTTLWAIAKAIEVEAKRMATTPKIAAEWILAETRRVARVSGGKFLKNPPKFFMEFDYRRPNKDFDKQESAELPKSFGKRMADL